MLPRDDARGVRRHRFRLRGRAQVVRRGPVPRPVPVQVQLGHAARVHPESAVEAAQQEPQPRDGRRRGPRPAAATEPAKGAARRRWQGDDAATAAAAQTVLRGQQTRAPGGVARGRDEPDQVETVHVGGDGGRGVRVFVILLHITTPGCCCRTRTLRTNRIRLNISPIPPTLWTVQQGLLFNCCKD